MWWGVPPPTNGWVYRPSRADANALPEENGHPECGIPTHSCPARPSGLGLGAGGWLGLGRWGIVDNGKRMAELETGFEGKGGETGELNHQARMEKGKRRNSKGQSF